VIFISASLFYIIPLLDSPVSTRVTYFREMA
jgi:hypothetical protein